MSTQVEAAVITAAAVIAAGGWTAAVAIVTSRTTRRVADQAAQTSNSNASAALDAAHEGRLWDKQTAVYEETVAFLLWRQLKRRNEIYSNSFEAAAAVERLSVYKPETWFEIQGRLLTYGSESVINGYQSGHDADGKVYGVVARWKELNRTNQAKLSAGDIASVRGGTDELSIAISAIDPALKDAQDKDQALIKLINKELGLKPSERRDHAKNGA